MRNVEDYIVLRVNGHIGVTLQENFVMTPVCETYGNYGQQNSDECFCADEEKFDGEHFEVMAWTYWDGHNWKSIRLDDPSVEEITGTEAEEIISEMPGTPFINGVHGTIESEHHFYCYTRNQDDPWIATVDDGDRPIREED